MTHGTTVDGVNLDEIREFAKAFKLRRLALGLTQTQVGQALSATKGPAYSQSAICRFEKLDITPKSAAKIKPVLEKWMQEAELKYADRWGTTFIFSISLSLSLSLSFFRPKIEIFKSTSVKIRNKKLNKKKEKMIKIGRSFKGIQVLSSLHFIHNKFYFLFILLFIYLI